MSVVILCVLEQQIEHVGLVLELSTLLELPDFFLGFGLLRFTAFELVFESLNDLVT